MPKRKKRELPKIGSVFERKFRRKIYTLKVVGSSEGVLYELGGRTFRTPTAAAKTIVKCEVNGWVFWKMDSK